MTPEQPDESPMVLPYASPPRQPSSRQAQSALIIGLTSLATGAVSPFLTGIGRGRWYTFVVIAWSVAICLGGVALTRGISVLLHGDAGSLRAIAAIVCGAIGMF